MVRATISIGRIAVTGQEDFSAERLGPCDGSVDVVYLEPAEQAVSRRHVVWIADASVVMLLFPAMQLQHKPASMDEPLVVRPAVVTLAIE
jgi:hypothetical protein